MLQKISSVSLVWHFHHVWCRTASLVSFSFLIRDTLLILVTQRKILVTGKNHVSGLLTWCLILDPCGLKRFRDLFPHWHFICVFVCIMAKSMSELWMGTLFVVAIFFELQWISPPLSGNLATLALMQPEIGGGKTEADAVGFTAGRIYDSGKPAHAWLYFEVSALVLSQRTIAFSFCGNESHSFPI